MTQLVIVAAVSFVALAGAAYLVSKGRRLPDSADATDRAAGPPSQASQESVDRLRAEVADRASAEQALRDSEARYRRLFLANPHPMWVYDRQTLKFLAVNDAALEFYGYSLPEFMALSFEALHAPEDIEVLRAELRRGLPEAMDWREWRHVRSDQRSVEVEVSSHAIVFDGRDAVLVQANDVTRRKELEAQMRQAQKMDAVGRLAGGVAHDFNNLITAILGYGRLAQKRGDLPPDTRRDVQQIEKAALRAATLTRQLLALSRQQVLQPRRLDLNRAIIDMQDMIQRLVGEDIDLVVAPATDLGAVTADPGQIEQVILNLVVNARDAMPDGGKLTIETSNVWLGKRERDGEGAGPAPGAHIMLAVSDDGIGMDAATQARIFEPFFTTKEVGRGTGLGLSTVHSIVSQSGGRVDVRSDVGKGTSFKVFLPRVEGVAEAPAEDLRDAPSGHESLLIVEDDDMIRSMMAESLSDHGYAVEEATDRNDAWQLCERRARQGSPPALMIVDVVMPGVGMTTFVERVHALLPDTKVLAISGYADRAMVHQGLLQRGVAFLPKPFSVETLLIKIRDVLDEPTSAAA